MLQNWTIQLNDIIHSRKAYIIVHKYLDMVTVKLERCKGERHIVDYSLGVPGVHVPICTCGKYRIRGAWTDDIQQVLQYVLQKSPKYQVITDKQYAAWVKKKLGIPLTSTERTHLQRFKEKARKILADCNELQKLSILDFPL